MSVNLETLLRKREEAEKELKHRNIYNPMDMIVRIKEYEEQILKKDEEIKTLKEALSNIKKVLLNKCY